MKLSSFLRLYALELCAANLEDYCKGKYKGQMPTEWDALLQIARGLEYIHLKHFVHRDIKPENVLISLPDEDGTTQMKIADFGLCKRTSAEGNYSLSGIKGTANFLAPEILNLEEKDLTTERGSSSSDVFSLGCTFFYFLSKGKHPFGESYAIASNISDGISDVTGKHILLIWHADQMYMYIF